MIYKNFACLTFLACLLSVPAWSQDQLPLFASMEMPYGAAPLDPARVQGITRTLMQYPGQAPGILKNYMNIDTSKIDFDKFNTIVARGDAQEIQAQLSVLADNRDAFNAGSFTDVPYYRVEPPPQPVIPASAKRPFVSTGGFYTSLAIVGAGVTAAAVSSGGGDGGSAPAPVKDAFGRTALPDIYDPASFVDAEFSAYPMNAMAQNRAQYAYAKGLTGEGVKIGFYDFFTDDSSGDPELNSRITYRNLNIPADTAALAPFCALYPGNPNACNHGGAVMGYAANERNGLGTMGIAYKATLLMNSVYATPDARPLADNGAQIINFSCSNCATFSDLQYIANKGVLMTAATGNGGTANPDAASPASYASLLDYKLLAVGGIYDIGAGITSAAYDRCGSQKDFCMVAYSDQGTSFAAPQVAGAAALIKQGWSFLTAKQIGQILLASAQDIGDPGVDAFYGHGLLDLQAATKPIGQASVLTGSGARASYAPSLISQNQATPFGDAFASNRNAKGNVTIVDAFGRDFNVKTQENLAVSEAREFSPDTMQSFGKKASAFKKMQLNDRLAMQFDRQENNSGQARMAGFAQYEVAPSVTMTMGYTNDINNLPADSLQEFNRFDFIDNDTFRNGFLNFSDNDQVLHQAVEIVSGDSLKTKFSTFYSKNSDTDMFMLRNDKVTSDFTSSMVENVYSPKETFALNFKNGMTHEFDSILGTKTSGSFDLANGANTYFSGVDVSYDVMPGWNLFGSYLFGATQAQPSATSAFNNVSDMTSDSFAVTATKDEVIGHDRLSFSVGQPTRVRSGIASGLTQQVDRQTGTIGVAEFEQSLVPTGRTIQFQGAYQKELSDKINLNFALKYETQPYQQKDADADASGLVKLMYKM